MIRRRLIAVVAATCLFACVFNALAQEDPPLDVISKELVGERTVAVFDFTKSIDGWTQGPSVTLSQSDSGLVATSSGSDPYFFSPPLEQYEISGDFLVKLTGRRTTTGFTQIFSAERDNPDYDETRATRFTMDESGASREYVVPMRTSSVLRQLRFDLGLDAGLNEVERIELVQLDYNPLKFGVFSIVDGALRLSVTRVDRGDDRLTIRSGDETIVKPLGADVAQVEETLRFPKKRPFESLEVEAALEKSGASTKHTFYAFHEDVLDQTNRADWPTLSSDALIVRFAPDASGAEIVRKDDGTRLAVLAPLLRSDFDKIEALELRQADEAIRCDYTVGSKRGSLTFRLDGEELNFELNSPRDVQAPIVRVLGDMVQAVLPGVEYLEQGECSSSTADVNPDERARYAPKPTQVTAPYATITTERCSATLFWNPAATQVNFAVPDFLDGDETSSRFNVIGSQLTEKLLFSDPEPIEETILRATREIGLPDVPPRPRTSEEENALHLEAFEGPALKLENGWGSAVGSGLDPDYVSYGSDFLSTIWELSGKIPETPRVNIAGAHLRNYVSLLVLKRGDILSNWINGEAEKIRNRQKEDGSFRYSGKYLRGSSVDYASGDCGQYVYRLLDHWRLTGNKDSLEAGLKGLEFVNSLKTPRGAQTWEISLHTPDIVASGHCSFANTLAYEATGDARYLEQARRWAISGLPFVYLWRLESFTDDDVMLYATIPVFGTTNWIAPCWIGTPVQWCGLNYAEALLRLSQYDDALDWRKIAEGIVASAERQEYPTGKYAGLVPDSFNIEAQQRNPLNINPCALHKVRWQLDDRHVDVYVKDVDGKRIVAPFPILIDENGKLDFDSQDRDFQILVDGEVRSADAYLQE
ncbi:MAG: hypothetical protein IJM54_08545 [Thermoguttaceae bacterium]|nr:hypothetical protein [Thermoguttaceae bacterium]